LTTDEKLRKSMALPTNKPKRLFLDVETSPNIGFFWTAGYKLNVGYENIIHERGTICVCYKWEGERKVYSLEWDSKQDDKKLLSRILRVMASADEIVAHNGDKYDISWIRTRALKHGLEMPPSYVTIDTLKIARSRFRFNSNRLDYLAKFLGIGKKIHTGFELWKDIVLRKDKGAMGKMIRYCKGDVQLLENVYKRLRNHIPAKTRINPDKKSCPECGTGTYINKTRYSAAGVKRVQRKCKNHKCNKMFTTNK
jgi:DNA polymerase elongation subunit (family B)